MPNKHLEHPEDSIFDGRRVALAAVKEMLLAKWNISVKWDGAPAIVFGTNPDNGKFFVGTKSVFNKKKVLINYSYEDIAKNHKGNVADILRLCYRYLPRISGIVQADWIGVGGGNVFSPNTVEYRFSTEIVQEIILAPHTCYDRISPDAEAKLGVKMKSTDKCYFVNTNDAYVGYWSGWKLAAEIVALIPFCKVPRSNKLREQVNGYIRLGKLPDEMEMFADAKYKGEVNVTTFKVWHKIFQLKQRLLDAIVTNGNVECFIDGKLSSHEGFVLITNNPYKIVDRLTFSKANFNLNKNW